MKKVSERWRPEISWQRSDVHVLSTGGGQVEPRPLDRRTAALIGERLVSGMVFEAGGGHAS